jgi:hypothetical protein
MSALVLYGVPGSPVVFYSGRSSKYPSSESVGLFRTARTQMNPVDLCKVGSRTAPREHREHEPEGVPMIIYFNFQLGALSLIFIASYLAS